MANPEHVKILKRGVVYWNKWRKENPEVVPDLYKARLLNAKLQRTNLQESDFQDAKLQQANLQRAELQRANLQGTNLRRGDLWRAELQGANLVAANLQESNLREVDLKESNLRKADLHKADLWRADLRFANLQEADLQGTNLKKANLVGSDLKRANLQGANLRQAYLNDVDFSEATFGGTQIDDIDLSRCLHLASIRHGLPSDISTSTFEKSKGQIPAKFLRGCGLTDWEIESVKLYQPNLSNETITDITYRIHEIRSTQAIQINPLFISYSHSDNPFVNTVAKNLTKKGVRFWLDIHHSIAGRLEKQVDRAMRLNPIVLLVLSRNSTNSDWVEHEAKKARKLEKELGRDVICPVALDDSWKTCKWPERLREQIEEYKILDFSDWEDGSEFEGMFARLLQGLDLFYKD